MKIDPMQVTKTQLWRVKVGGVFGGKNIFDIDETGNLLQNDQLNLQGKNQ